MGSGISYLSQPSQIAMLEAALKLRPPTSTYNPYANVMVPSTAFPVDPSQAYADEGQQSPIPLAEPWNDPWMTVEQAYGLGAPAEQTAQESPYAEYMPPEFGQPPDQILPSQEQIQQQAAPAPVQDAVPQQAAPAPVQDAVPQQAAPAAAPLADPRADPWANIGNTYQGLGSPSAQGMPASMSGVQIGAAPTAQASLIDPSSIPQTQASLMNLSQIPQTEASLIDPSSIPQPVAQQMGISDDIKAMAGGQGYSPSMLAQLKALAMQANASAGAQRMGQAKRTLGQNGISGGANAAVLDDVARQTGQSQTDALANIDINNAQVGNANRQFGIGQETSIGQNNMQASNAMSLANAAAMFAAFQSNQAAKNAASSENASRGFLGQQQNQSAENSNSQANANRGFTGQQANQTAQNNTNQMNTGLQFQRQENQANMDFNNQKSQWDELNKRYSQAQNILGSWGAAA